MKDRGLDKALVLERDDSKRSQRGWSKGFFSFRKMFWEYLKKLHVPFFDECCPLSAEEEGTFPVRWNATLGRLEYFNGTEWADITAITETTTTTTTSTTTTSSTTTTTTAP